MTARVLLGPLVLLLALGLAIVAGRWHDHHQPTLTNVDQRVFPQRATRSYDRYLHSQDPTTTSTTTRAVPVATTVPVRHTTPASTAPVQHVVVAAGNGPVLASWYTCSWCHGGFASRNMFPRGTHVRFCHAGRCVTAIDDDYGPATWTGRTFDLDEDVFAQIGDLGSGVITVTWQVVG